MHLLRYLPFHKGFEANWFGIELAVLIIGAHYVNFGFDIRLSSAHESTDHPKEIRKLKEHDPDVFHIDIAFLLEVGIGFFNCLQHDVNVEFTISLHNPI